MTVHEPNLGNRVRVCNRARADASAYQAAKGAAVMLTKSLAKEFGPSAGSIARWATQTERDGGRGGGGVTSVAGAELVRLRREVRRLKEELEILSKAAAWFANESTATPKRSSDS